MSEANSLIGTITKFSQTSRRLVFSATRVKLDWELSSVLRARTRVTCDETVMLSEAGDGAKMSPISAPPNPFDHFKGCCAEMITFLAVIYFLKSVLNFDVFWGPSQLHKHRAGGKTEDEEEEKGKWPSPVSRLYSLRDTLLGEESFTPDVSEEDSDLELGEADHDNDDVTNDKSYDVSAWGLSEDSDSDEAHTSLSEESEDALQPQQISVDLDKDSESDEDTQEPSEDDSTYKTEWYCQYEEQKRQLESDKRCTSECDS